MLMIRLERMGKKKQPSYRVIVSEKTKDPHAGSLELLGHYNPIVNPKVLDLKADRITYWLEQGATPSATVHNLLVQAGIVTGDKQGSVSISTKRHTKLNQKKAEAEEKAKAAAEAAAAAEPEATPEEAPAAEEPAA